MFEPEMSEGTRFQIMYNRVELDYLAPKIELLLAQAHAAGEKPKFAFYINCAGRAAGYGSVDYEDAAVIQKVLAERVPLLGIYDGVEIAGVGGRPRCLDWTGVFCLISEK
jgi:small ligand-binding sensory domain FIST